MKKFALPALAALALVACAEETPEEPTVVDTTADTTMTEPLATDATVADPMATDTTMATDPMATPTEGAATAEPTATATPM